MSPKTLLLRCGSAVALAAALTLAVGQAHAAAPPAWKMQLTMAPTPVSSNGNTVFTLRVTNASGRPVNGGKASLDLVMTTMDMGPNHVTLAPHGNGVYTGRGAFSMDGPWRVDVTFSGAGRTSKKSFPVQVK